jgi:curved DNA-binding protein CbpA
MKSLMCFTTVLFLLLASCNTKSNEELLIGEWRLDKAELIDKSIANEEILKQINNQEELLKNEIRRRFDSDKRYREFDRGHLLDKEDKIEFRLLDEKGELSQKGHIIDFEMFERDGSRYLGTNKQGPFEIIKITENELILKSLELRYKIKRQEEEMTEKLKEMIRQQENVLQIYHRVSYLKTSSK